MRLTGDGHVHSEWSRDTAARDQLRPGEWRQCAVVRVTLGHLTRTLPGSGMHGMSGFG